MIDYFTAAYGITPNAMSGVHIHYEKSYEKHKTVKNIIFNPPATIMFFEDGTKTVVKCMKGEDYDPEKGAVLAFLKHELGEKKYKKLLKYIDKKIIKPIEVKRSHNDFANCNTCKWQKNGICYFTEDIVDLNRGFITCDAYEYKIPEDKFASKYENIPEKI